MSITITYFEAPVSDTAPTVTDAMARVLRLYPEASFVHTMPPTEPALWAYPSEATRQAGDTDQAVALLREAATAATEGGD